jgi:hypothetical protein
LRGYLLWENPFAPNRGWRLSTAHSLAFLQIDVVDGMLPYSRAVSRVFNRHVLPSGFAAFTTLEQRSEVFGNTVGRILMPSFDFGRTFKVKVRLRFLLISESRIVKVLGLNMV